MRIFLRELSDRTTELHFTQNDAWVASTISSVDEKIDNEITRPNASATSSTPRAATIDMNLHKVDEVVVVTGKIDTSIDLVCSRCASHFLNPLHFSFTSLYCKDPVMAGIAHLPRKEPKKYGQKKNDDVEDLKPIGQNKGYARHAHNDDNEDKDTDITYLTEDFIELENVLIEQLQLQIPFQPLCKEDCKGICSNCGADLNQGRCACSKIKKDSPFAALKEFRF